METVATYDSRPGRYDRAAMLLAHGRTEDLGLALGRQSSRVYDLLRMKYALDVNAFRRLLAIYKPVVLWNFFRGTGSAEIDRELRATEVQALEQVRRKLHGAWEPTRRYLSHTKSMPTDGAWVTPMRETKS